MPALVKELGIEGLASLQALVPSLVEELAAEGEHQRWPHPFIQSLGACGAAGSHLFAGSCRAVPNAHNRALCTPGTIAANVMLPPPPPPPPRPGSVAGKLAAGGASWVPAAYVAAQQDAVRAFFQQNGYIGYDTVRWLTAGLLCSQRLPLV